MMLILLGAGTGCESEEKGSETKKGEKPWMQQEALLLFLPFHRDG